MHPKTMGVFAAALLCFCLLGCNRSLSVTYVKTHPLDYEGKTVRVRGQVKSIDPASNRMILWDGSQSASPQEILVPPCPQGVDKGYIVDVEGQYDPDQSKLKMDSCNVVERPTGH